MHFRSTGLTGMIDSSGRGRMPPLREHMCKPDLLNPS
jgi:hypothetical protein